MWSMSELCTELALRSSFGLKKKKKKKSRGLSIKYDKLALAKKKGVTKGSYPFRFTFPPFPKGSGYSKRNAAQNSTKADQ